MQNVKSKQQIKNPPTNAAIQFKTVYSICGKTQNICAIDYAWLSICLPTFRRINGLNWSKLSTHLGADEIFAGV